MFNKYDFAAVSSLAIGIAVSAALTFNGASSAESAETVNLNAINPSDPAVYRVIAERVYTDQGIKLNY